MSIPVRTNTLPKDVQKCWDGGKNNHSLRVTASTTLFEAGVSEKVIQNATGHRSLKVLRIYGCVNKEQEGNVSRARPKSA